MNADDSNNPYRPTNTQTKSRQEPNNVFALVDLAFEHRRKARQREAVTAVSMVIAIIVLAQILFGDSSMISRVGALVGIIGVLGHLPCTIAAFRLSLVPASEHTDGSPKQFLSKEISRVNRQIDLSHKTAGWVLTLLLICSCLISIGINKYWLLPVNFFAFLLAVLLHRQHIQKSLVLLNQRFAVES